MLFHIGHRWKDLSISLKLYSVVGIMASLILVELLTLRFAMETLSSLRATVAGEGIWAKGQKQAVYQLQRYALTKNETDYQDFLKALEVNNGDHLARIQMLKSNLDMEIIKKGFTAGQIHPDDIIPIVNLLTRFSSTSYISKAMEEWAKGDLLLEELKKTGKEFHDLVTTRPDDTKALLNLSNRVHILNDHLTKVSNLFSKVLGEGSRRIENLVFVTLSFLVLTVGAVGLTLTYFTGRSLSSRLSNLIQVADKVGQGQFDQRLTFNSKDEIGQLTIAINNMGILLQNSYQELEKKIELRTYELALIASENTKLYERAKSAVETRDEFLSIAAHELRTPITSIQLQLQMIDRMINHKQGEAIDLAKISEGARKAVRIGKHLSSLRDVLMDLTSISLGKLEIRKEKIELVQVTSDAVSFALEITQSKSKIVFSLNGPLFVHADPLRIGQVISNLINNAIKYGEGSQIDISISEDQHFMSVHVSDYGPGIPQDKQILIFNRFERANSDAGLSGFGLGLYVSRQIIEAHNGNLSLVSRLKEGTTFSMSIPKDNVS